MNSSSKVLTLETKYLYRGVSTEFHRYSKGRLHPKDLGALFTYTFHWGEPGSKWGDGSTWGESEVNAVIRHQLNQEGYPTAGISTTPHLHRAMLYARGESGISDGFVYKIDRWKCQDLGIREFVVSEYARIPSVPEDDEVLLVARDSGELPIGIISEVISVVVSET